MMSTKLYPEAFITGADNKTEWMLPWFFENYKKHNTAPILFADFGVKDIDAIKPYVHAVINLKNINEKGWFKKPKAMIHAPVHKLVWIDSDCEILGNIKKIFNLLEPFKLNMVEDLPWSKRRRETWFNSGVVGIINKPLILKIWAQCIEQNPMVGDQEVLHTIINPLNEKTYINKLPNIFNWLRLQIENDGQDDENKLIMHWTGQKGKDHIRKLINE